MDDNATPHHTVAAPELFGCEDIHRMDWREKPSDLNPTKHLWEIFEKRLADLISLQQRSRSYNWRNKKNGSRSLNSSLTISYSSIDYSNLPAHSGVTIFPYKDWIFLVSRLSHGSFCDLYSCAETESYLLNKIIFVSFGFLFWKLRSLFQYSYIFRIFTVRFVWIWSSFEGRYIKNTTPPLIFVR